ncbi:hypothetical protein [Halostella litorea]|uniref:hypothetical protein n=1 Tax=Halostella litorea TaxID=2528831 RepID=UPI001092DBB9|nr:hypothetical protein [Halostella litorea]
MSNSESTLDRRTLLRSVGGAAALTAVPSAATGATRAEATHAVAQGGTCTPVVPLSGDRPVERLYDLRIPDRFGGENGATDPGSGPYYGSVGTRDLQRSNTSVSFLYDGPNGLSLVVVHGAFDGGGAASWRVEGVPQGASWAVKDDLYLDPDTGEPAERNYDRWAVDGTTHRIDWTWGDSGTDGGALRGLGDEFALAVDPAFNGAAALADGPYDGEVTDWQFLSFPDGRASPERVPLALDRELVVRAGGCGGGGDPGGGDEGGDKAPDEVEVDVDVKPGSGDAATVNPRSRGVIPVAVRSDAVDPAAVDAGTVRFGPPAVVDDGGGAGPVHGGHPADGALVLHFRAAEAGFSAGDDAAKLVGKADGVSVVGTADVRIVGSEGDDSGDAGRRDGGADDRNRGADGDDRGGDSGDDGPGDAPGGDGDASSGGEDDGDSPPEGRGDEGGGNPGRGNGRGRGRGNDRNGSDGGGDGGRGGGGRGSGGNGRGGDGNGRGDERGRGRGNGGSNGRGNGRRG